MGQRSFFDVENRLQSVRRISDPLERLASATPGAALSRAFFVEHKATLHLLMAIRLRSNKHVLHL